MSYANTRRLAADLGPAATIFASACALAVWLSVAPEAAGSPRIASVLVGGGLTLASIAAVLGRSRRRARDRARLAENALARQSATAHWGLRAAGTVVFSLDADCRILERQPAGTWATMGLATGSLLAAELARNGAQPIAERIVEAVALGKSISMEVVITHLVQHPMPVLLSGLPVYDPGNAGCVYQLSITDRAALQRARAAHDAATKTLHSVLQNHAAFAWQTDEAGRLIAVTGERAAGALALWRLARGQPLWAIPRRIADDAQQGLWQLCLAARQPLEHLRVGLRDELGKAHWYSLCGTPEMATDGRFLGYTGTGQDISRIVATEQALLASEARYQRLLEHTPDAVLVHRDGIVLSCNPAAARLLQFEDESRAVGQSLLACVADECRDAFIERIVGLGSVPQGRASPGSSRVLLAGWSGMRMELETSDALIEFDGRPAILSMLRDVSSHRWIEAELQESRERYRLLFDLAPDAVFVTRRGLILLANASCARLFGVSSADDLAGAPLARFIHAEDRDAVAMQLATVESAGDDRFALTPEYALAGSPDGRPDPTETRLDTALSGAWAPRQPIPRMAERRGISALGGEFILESVDVRIRINHRPAVLSTGRDISDRKLAENEIRELNARLERRVLERTAQVEASNKELEAFSYSVSHDLRAPLRGIDGFAQILLEDYSQRLDDHGRACLGRIRLASQRMAMLIDDLLDLARVGRLPLHRRPVDLSALAHEICKEFIENEPDRRHEIHIEPGLEVQADPQLMRVVLENLLRNAWKFSRIAPVAHIRVAAVPESDQPSFVIADNGTGFDMAHVDKLFRPFERLHVARDFEGTGIGLATVARVIERHGGHVRAESQPGQGARFFFTLP